MAKHEPKPCVICGNMFTPTRTDIVTCSNPECKRKRRNEKQLEWYKNNYTHALETRRSLTKLMRETYTVEEPHERKPDTIVAIGYAERQKAKTLEMAGKVRTEL